MPAYAASKGAVGQLTKSFANEWTSKGVTVNAIAPGYIETEMNEALLKDEERLKSISARIPAGRVSHLVFFFFLFVFFGVFFFFWSSDLSLCRRSWLT